MNSSKKRIVWAVIITIIVVAAGVAYIYTNKMKETSLQADAVKEWKSISIYPWPDTVDSIQYPPNWDVSEFNFPCTNGNTDELSMISPSATDVSGYENQTLYYVVEICFDPSGNKTLGYSGFATGATNTVMPVQINLSAQGLKARPEYQTAQQVIDQNLSGGASSPLVSIAKEVTILVPDNLADYRSAMTTFNQIGTDDPVYSWPFIKMTATSTIADPVKASAEAAAEYITPLGGGPAHAHIAYFKIVNGTAYVVLDIDLDGWAGVSNSIAQIDPIILKTLLQFPQIKTVLFAPAPGDTRTDVRNAWQNSTNSANINS